MTFTAKRKSSSNAVISGAHTLAVKNAHRKRKAKKWSKERAKQTQKDVDGQVHMLYSVHAMHNCQELAITPESRQDVVDTSVQALEETLRDL